MCREMSFHHSAVAIVANEMAFQRKTRCTEVKGGFKVITHEWKTYTLLKTSNAPFIMLPISSMIII